jgi:hypothetical protein
VKFFQLDALKVSVAGVIVTAAVFPETKFIVLVPFGLPDKATESNAVEPSFTVVAPVNTALLSLSAVSILNVAFGVAGAVAVIATVSVVSFTSSTPDIVTVCAVLQQFGPGQTLSNVILAVPKETDPTVPDASDTTSEGVGSAPSLTVKLAVPPSLMLVGFPARIILIVFTSTVLTTTVSVTSPTPLPVMVTASAIMFASEIPETRTDCGIFQLVVLNETVVGRTAKARVFDEERFKVLAVPGFPERATERNATPPSVTEVAPVNTGFVSFSIVSNTELALVTDGAVAEIVTFSLVSFTSSTPVSVIV